MRSIVPPPPGPQAAPTRNYSPDLVGVARLMEDRAADARDQPQFEVSQLLASITDRHEVNDEGWGSCRGCGADWPCADFAAAEQVALSWLIREVTHPR